MNHV